MPMYDYCTKSGECIEMVVAYKGPRNIYQNDQWYHRMPCAPRIGNFRLSAEVAALPPESQPWEPGLKKDAERAKEDKAAKSEASIERFLASELANVAI